MAAERVDSALVSLGLCGDIKAARALVMAGCVYLGEIKVSNASDPLKPGFSLHVREPKCPFVSRGGMKLQKALALFGLRVGGLVCLDVGSSTGGFTDCLLRAGASRVYAVDVGYGLLDYRLRTDPRVTVMERTNARFLKAESFDPRPSFGATDVSFISLRAVLPASLSVLDGESRRFVALIKPQFEALPRQVGVRGVVRDPRVHREVVSRVVSFVRSQGWQAQSLGFSPVTGPEGNIEFLADFRPKALAEGEVCDLDIERVVEAAHDNFMKSS